MKKNRKDTFKVGDPNAKAMWSRTRHKVEKSKKKEFYRKRARGRFEDDEFGIC